MAVSVGFRNEAKRERKYEKLVLFVSLCCLTVYLTCGCMVVNFKEQFQRISMPSRENFVIEKTIAFLNETIPYAILSSPRYSACTNGTHRLSAFIAVLSPTNAFSIRTAIRQSWANSSYSYSLKKQKAVICFIIGTMDDDEVMENVTAESEEHGDILLTSIDEDYANLTLKVYSAIEFKREQCPRAKFLVKVDDDVLLSVDRLVKATKTMKDNMTAYGHVWKKVKPKRSPTNKWFVPRQRYAPEHFPLYTSGPAYVIPKEALDAIYSQLSNVSWLTVEDAFYTGVVAERAGVRRKEQQDFLMWKKPVPKKWPCGRDGQPLLAAVHGFKTPHEIVHEYREMFRIECSRKDEPQPRIIPARGLNKTSPAKAKVSSHKRGRGRRH